MYRVAKETGVPTSVLSRFIVEGRGLRSENIDRLCAYFGLRLTGKGKPAKRAKES